MKQIARVLNLVNRCPVHCHDVASVLHIDPRAASARLGELHTKGLIVRQRQYVPIGRTNQCWIYERKTT